MIIYSLSLNCLINGLLSSWQEVETYFFEGLLKWRELNLTEHFGIFYFVSVSPVIYSLHVVQNN